MQRSGNPRVSVVVPTRNEARNLEVVLPAVAAVQPTVHEIILVDGGRSTAPSRPRAGPAPTVKVVHQTRRGKGNALACGFAAGHRRHHRDVRRRRLDRPRRDPGLRRGAGRRRRLRQGLPLRRRRRQRRHHPAAPRRQRRFLNGSSTCCSAPATPTSATATTPSGPTCSRVLDLPDHDAARARRRHALGRRLRDRDRHQLPGRRRRPRRSPRSPASNASASSARPTCAPSPTAPGCCGRWWPSAAGPCGGTPVAPAVWPARRISAERLGYDGDGYDGEGRGEGTRPGYETSVRAAGSAVPVGARAGA